MPNNRLISGFGCCLAARSFVPQQEKANESQDDAAAGLVNGVREALGIGYDFAELTVGALTGLTDSEFEEVVDKLTRENLIIPAFNSFIPASLKITGPSVDLPVLESHIDLAVHRVKSVGGRIIVFGSGGARNVPDNYSLEEGIAQIKKFLSLCSVYAVKYGVTIVIEPLNRKESNVINTVAQALELAEELDLPGIQVLADAYHMYLEREPLDIIIRAVNAGRLAHVHYAEFDRSFPVGQAENGVDFDQLFTLLQEVGYTGGISAECSSKQIAVDSERSLSYIKRIWNEVSARSSSLK